jgi:uncharacterized phage-associated protein
MDKRVFKNTVLLIIELAGEKGIGAIKLNKCLLINDAMYYALHRVSLTDATYTKDKFGPVPDKEAREIIEQMIKSGDIIVSNKKLTSEKIEKNHTLPPGLRISRESFKDEDINRLSYVVKTVMKMSADELSEVTHDREYKETRNHEEIDLNKIYSWKISDEPLNEDESNIIDEILERELNGHNNFVQT